MADTADEIVTSILQNALDYRASDIHMEPERDHLNIRFRIDGILHLFNKVDKYLKENTISKIKVLSNMNIAERRQPQDGHFEFLYKSVLYNFRVSILPALFGENIVIRILNREDMLLKLNNTGLERDQLLMIHKLLLSTSGMILITGPTSSGKTNLLYSILDFLNRPFRNIITLEDPIEYRIEGIRQSQVNESIGFTFAKAMRSVIRQDPDIIMLGEIRDADTTRMAIQAALIGTLVLSTFHTFDVPALVTRLLEMGITHVVVAQTIKAVITSRLVRKICTSCRSAFVPNSDEKKLVGENVATLFKAKGCHLCKATGYLGRTGIYEITYFDNDIKTAIVENQPVSYLNQLLKKKQIHSLKTSALNKVYGGITSIEEIYRVLGSELLNE
ncbi:hypothetical protein A3I50_00585 [Candidatus Roizmanbacteria bacterium RIFCSPLOWO2_02_FULL_37_9]|nr:MAG: hypothetical protein A3I50_00585 [Candidatus Roizmanbacteria bacterium RIFCSPLOWO2_02_FULL_37_9]